MSSSKGPGDGACRLHLGEDFVRLERPGLPDERRACAPGTAEHRAALRAIGVLEAEPVTLVLPAVAFAVADPGNGMLARRRARRSLARALGVEPRALLLEAGRAEGRVRLVGLPAEAARDAVRFLAAQGVRVAAIEPDPALLPGGRVPAFREGLFELNSSVPARAPWIRPAWRLAFPTGLAAAALAALIAGSAGDGGREVGEPDRAAAAAHAGSDGGAAVPGRQRAPVAVPMPRVHAAAPSLGAPRPMDRPGLAPVRAEAAPKRTEAAPPPASPGRPATVMASRSVPPEIREAALAAVSRSASGAGHARVAVLGPAPRPAALGASALDVPVPEMGAAAPVIPRPLARPADGEAVRGTEAGPLAAEGRPRPRPGAEADRLAAAVEAAIAAVAPAAAAPGGPESPSVARPEPRSFAPTPAAGGAVRVTPPISAAPVEAAPAAERRPPPQVTRVEPARALPAPQAQPAPQAPAAQAGLRGSGRVTLVGVFGTSSRRHALVRLPDGRIERVRAGDAVNGVQIAAIGEETVRVRVNGHDGVLRLPD